MSSCQLSRKAKCQKQGAGDKDTVSWIGDWLIVMRDGVRRRDILTADDTIHQERCGCELEYDNPEPFEAMDVFDFSIQLYIMYYT